MRLISTSHLAEAVGVPLALLSQWLKRGILAASGERERIGQPRGWLVNEAVTLAIFVERLSKTRSVPDAAGEALGMASAAIRILNEPHGPDDAANHILFVTARWPDGRLTVHLSLDPAEAGELVTVAIEAGASAEVTDVLPAIQRVIAAFQQHAYDAPVTMTGADLARQAGEQVMTSWSGRPTEGSA